MKNNFWNVYRISGVLIRHHLVEQCIDGASKRGDGALLDEKDLFMVLVIMGVWDIRHWPTVFLDL